MRNLVVNGAMVCGLAAGWPVSVPRFVVLVGALGILGWLAVDPEGGATDD